ncbi:hypothetical protein [Paractinoplanes toevensis]|uniref:Uncharacterized protein n=1 Tax=Paractinoplanes toevensis TaxID=571911 RepID=A0A919W7S4_9ACTN|nr:hypothetical protein [Actinoplanes toevensis]GIM90126.1 hypothetical protein Ato02nite_019190 [Actinoplanes toevensis]
MSPPRSAPHADDPNDSGTAHLAPPLPAGARLLTADEAVAVLITGEHPDGDRGTLAFDAALVEALRQGWLLACRLPDGQIAFTRPTLDTPGQPPTS